MTTPTPIPPNLYEIIDTSSDEGYFILGLFDSFESAKAELDKRLENKNESITDFGDCMDYEKIEIVERSLGWNNHRKTVFYIERQRVLVESIDDYVWSVIN